MNTVKFVLIILLISFLALFVPGQESNPLTIGETIDFENGVFEEINSVRQNPSKFARYVEDYKALLRGNVLYLPSRKPFLTFEGETALEEAAKTLRTTDKMLPLVRLENLNASARAQLNDLLEDRQIGHLGKDGANLNTRLLRFGIRRGPAAENITFADATSRQVVATMLIDDGVPERPHRKNVLNTVFRAVGIACGHNADKNFICVTIFAQEFLPLSLKPFGLTPDSGDG